MTRRRWIVYSLALIGFVWSVYDRVTINRAVRKHGENMYYLLTDEDKRR